MALIHIYDKETGKLMRSQEPKVDVLETQAQGITVYVKYPNSTELPLPSYGEHEHPFFVDGAWVVKQQYKGEEVYNTETKSFEHCYEEELKENQVFIDDKEGIENFKKDPMKYIVNDDFEIVENPQYDLLMAIQEIEGKLSEADSKYQEFLQTPQVFVVTGKLYKPVWIDDGTYTKVITGVQAGLIQFPINIWDATEKEENMVSMDQEMFSQLCAFLAYQQAAAFDQRKAAKSALIAQKEELEAQLNA